MIIESKDSKFKQNYQTYDLSLRSLEVQKRLTLKFREEYSFS